MATVKIVILGPESTGKTTLTQALAKHFEAPFVAEYAREYLAQKADRAYELKDLEAIGKGQVKAVQKALALNPPILFCDTDLVTLHIWSLDKFDQAIPFVEAHMKTQQADLYLLCKPDLKWEYDPLREDANRRDELFDWHLWVLKSMNALFIEIAGQGEKRTACAISAVESHLKP